MDDKRTKQELIAENSILSMEVERLQRILRNQKDMIRIRTYNTEKEEQFSFTVTNDKELSAFERNLYVSAEIISSMCTYERTQCITGRFVEACKQKKEDLLKQSKETILKEVFYEFINKELL